MSAALELVAQLAEKRAVHQAGLAKLEPAFVDALRKAVAAHGLRETARHAGLTHTGVKYLTEREEKT